MMKFVSMRSMLRAGLACAAVFAATTVANAAALFIDDHVPDPAPISVSANDFELGLSINGSPFQSGLFSPASGDFAGNDIFFDGTFFTGTVGPDFTRTVYFIDPLNPAFYRATVTYTFENNINAHLTGLYSGGLFAGVPGGTLADNTIPIGVDFNFDYVGFGGVIRTPEPASALALVALGVLARRRR